MTYGAFICYETRTGTSYVKNLHEALGNDGTNAFLAGSNLLTKHIWRREINSALDNAPIFIIVFTSGVKTSEEVLKECKRASELKKDFITCRWHEIPISLTEIQISEKEKLSDYHQIEFEDKYDLANKVLLEIIKLREE